MLNLYCNTSFINYINPEEIVKGNKCQILNICGNGYVEVKEECDDNNQQVGDGCNKCQVEHNWICNEADPSECSFQKNPIMIVSALYELEDFQYLRIQFSEQIQTQELPLSSTISFNIVNLTDNVSKFNLKIEKEATTTLSFASYKVGIKINQLLTTKPILLINLNQNVYNLHNVSIINNPLQKVLQFPQYLNPQQKNVTQVLSNINKNIIYSLGFLSLSQLIFGSLSLFEEILSTLY